MEDYTFDIDSIQLTPEYWKKLVEKLTTNMNDLSRMSDEIMFMQRRDEPEEKINEAIMRNNTERDRIYQENNKLLIIQKKFTQDWEERKSKVEQKKYLQSGHLVDQKLKYKTPKKQPSLFDVLLPTTKQVIEDSKIEVSVEGIKLTYSENKLINAFSLLLHEKSQKNDDQSDSFYSGNGTFEMVSYGQPDKTAIAPVLKFRPSELYKSFMGGEKCSGSDIKHIISTLKQLESKKFLINYDRVKKVREGNKTKTLTDRIEDFQSLFKVVSFIPDLTEEEKKSIEGTNSARESRGEVIVLLNPIFKDQIDTKFIEFPIDTARRLVIAAGGHSNVTASMDRLMEYMLREISAKRYYAEMNEDTLPYMLGLEKYVKQNRKKLLQDRIEKDIQAVINMGIILKVEKKPNACGTEKWGFHLNKDYH